MEEDDPFPGWMEAVDFSSVGFYTAWRHVCQWFLKLSPNDQDHHRNLLKEHWARAEQWRADEDLGLKLAKLFREEQAMKEEEEEAQRRRKQDEEEMAKWRDWVMGKKEWLARIGLSANSRSRVKEALLRSSQAELDLRYEKAKKEGIAREAQRRGTHQTQMMINKFFPEMKGKSNKQAQEEGGHGDKGKDEVQAPLKGKGKGKGKQKKVAQKEQEVKVAQKEHKEKDHKPKKEKKEKKEKQHKDNTEKHKEEDHKPKKEKKEKQHKDKTEKHKEEDHKSKKRPREEVKSEPAAMVGSESEEHQPSCSGTGV
jgi:hypothetical protein